MGTVTARAIEEEPISWQVAHAALSRLARERAAADAVEGRWLLAAQRAAVHVHLGFGSFGEYVERLFGYQRRSTQEKLRVAEALEGLPALEQSLSRGDLSWSALRELTRVVVPDTEQQWLELARGKTLRQLEELLAGRRPGDGPAAPPEVSARRHVLRFEVMAETFALFRDALKELERRQGARLEDDAALLEMARGVLGGPLDEGRASYQVVLSVCPACGGGRQQTDGSLVPIAPDIVAMARCDGQHLGFIIEPRPEVANDSGSPLVGALPVRGDPCARANRDRKHPGTPVHSGPARQLDSEAHSGSAPSDASAESPWPHQQPGAKQSEPALHHHSMHHHSAHHHSMHHHSMHHHSAHHHSAHDHSMHDHSMHDHSMHDHSAHDHSMHDHSCTSAPAPSHELASAEPAATTPRAHVGARAQQSIPPSLRRAVLLRDERRCRVPGCQNTRFLDLHHIELRSEGGRHTAENLLCLCSAHHRAAHRGELLLERGVAGALQFRHADGSDYGQLTGSRAIETHAKVFSALRHLGFREGEVRAVFRQLESEGALPEATFDQILRAALARLRTPR